LRRELQKSWEIDTQIRLGREIQKRRLGREIAKRRLE
jgi:hypothetical protein